MNYFERDDDESAIQGRKEICREIFGDSDISDEGDLFDYDEEEYNILEAEFRSLYPNRFKKNDKIANKQSVIEL